MLIRSQDKKVLVNMDVISSIYVDEVKERKSYEVKLNLKKIGEYSTEEKAIKVLDSIQDFYTWLEYEKFIGSDKGTLTSVVFEMPQDSEV